jgi:hypothetical protein
MTVIVKALKTIPGFGAFFALQDNTKAFHANSRRDRILIERAEGRRVKGLNVTLVL